ncbi:MAG: methyltransferase domain-containing protein, partial [Fusobacteriaceae bacterium]
MRFDKFLSTYDSYAFAQKKVAEKLSGFFSPNEKFCSVLEIGCGTGIYTRELEKRIKFEKIILNDIYDTEKYFCHLENSFFLKRDMDQLMLEKYSLITSSSAFQWSRDLKKLLNKVSFAGENLIFSIYTRGNLIEIENHFGISLKYYEEKEILEELKKYFSNIESET